MNFIQNIITQFEKKCHSSDFYNTSKDITNINKAKKRGSYYNATIIAVYS